MQRGASSAVAATICNVDDSDTGGVTADASEQVRPLRATDVGHTDHIETRILYARGELRSFRGWG
jgi:hypothetical protein